MKNLAQHWDRVQWCLAKEVLEKREVLLEFVPHQGAFCAELRDLEGVLVRRAAVLISESWWPMVAPMVRSRNATRKLLAGRAVTPQTVATASLLF